MIKSFKDKKTARFFEGKDVKEFRSFADQLTRRLAVLNDAEKQQDLTELRSNRFELLTGYRKGQDSAVFVLTNSGLSAFVGNLMGLRMLKLSITIKEC